MMKRLALITILYALCFPVLAQQRITVSGVVKDSAGEPLMGVGVVEKGTTNGVVTDLDGSFQLNATEGADLEFSCLGYTTVTVAATRGPMNVTLQDDSFALDETVVIGYGVQRKSSVTGAISSVKASDLANRTVTSVQSSLQGKTAGVQILTTSGAPGAESQVRVRGYSSNSSNNPLYVVDGLRITNIGSIDPNDIESMEVLKDAASAAIYGAQAGNGVVLITTKKATKGISKVTYDLQISTQSLTRVPEVLNAKEYINYFVNEGKLISQDLISGLYDGKTDTYWADVAFENSFMQRHNLSFSGANDKASIYASVSYLDNNGPVIGDHDVQKRIAATLNAEYKINQWLKFSSNNQFGKSSSQSVLTGGFSSVMASALTMDPLTPVVYKASSLPGFMQNLVDQGHYFIKDDNGDYYSISGFQETNNCNPYILNASENQKNDSFDIHGATSLDISPWKTLVFTSRFGYDFRNSYYYYVKVPHVICSDSLLDYQTVNANNSTNTYYQWENFVNYNESFGKHTIGAMVGMSFSERVTFNTYGSVSGSGLSDIGFTKLDKNFAYFANATGTASKSLSGGEKCNFADLSYFGRISYDYDGKYYLQASLRADAADTSILPKQNRWGYFPAASAGWTISRENWFKDLNLSAITNLKARVSWGQNGSIAGLGNYRYAANISSNIKFLMDPTASSYAVGSMTSSTGNYGLKWETSEQTNVGLDLRMFSDRLSFSMDWFTKKTKDLIVTGISSSKTVGNTLSPTNAGNVTNTGLEFELGWQDTIGDFNYRVSGNVSTLKNEVTYVHESLTRIGGGGNEITCYFEKGYPMWYMRGYEYTGVDPQTGDPLFKDIDGDGMVNDNDRCMIGSGIPDVTYGLTVNMGWKGFDFLVFASGAAGNEVAWSVPRTTRLKANILKTYYDDRWTAAGQDAKYPRANPNNWSSYVKSSAFVFDGSYLKIKQIQLGYSLPKKVLAKTGLSNARVYVSLDDFFCFAKYPGFDPEVSQSSSAIGIDFGQYPVTKKAVFGLNITF